VKRITWAILLSVSVLVVLAATLIIYTSQRQRPDAINSWLWDETQDWLSKDPTHKISVVAWFNKQYLDTYGINKTDIVEWLVTEHNATVRYIGVMDFIIADIPANQIVPISRAHVIQFLFSGTNPQAEPLIK